MNRLQRFGQINVRVVFSIALVVVGFSIVSPAYTQGKSGKNQENRRAGEKVTICHLNDSGGFDLISVSSRAAERHLEKHAFGGIGDFEPAGELCDDFGYAIGDTGPAGGIVFYVEEDGLSGLEAAQQDQGMAHWGCNRVAVPSDDLGVYETPPDYTYTLNEPADGAVSTAAILDLDCEDSDGSAATIADGYSTVMATDWFLPTEREFALIQSSLIDAEFADPELDYGFKPDRYWTSTSAGTLGPDPGFARVWFAGSIQADDVRGDDNDKTISSYYVRPVRQF